MNENKWYNHLRCNIEIMMQTDMIRDKKKLKVTNEITNVMEYYTVFLLFQILCWNTSLAKEHGLSWTTTSDHNGAWIGGDREESVCNSWDLEAFSTIQSEVIWTITSKRFQNYTVISPLSTSLSKTSEAVAEMAALSSDTSVFREKEPYRRAFHISSQNWSDFGQFKRMDYGWGN